MNGPVHSNGHTNNMSSELVFFLLLFNHGKFPFLPDNCSGKSMEAKLSALLGIYDPTD